MKREWTKIVVAFVVLTGLALAVSLHREHEEKESIKSEQSKKLLPIKAEDIQKIEFTNRYGSLILERRSPESIAKDSNPIFIATDRELDHVPDWKITKPFESLADQEKVEGLISDLVDLSYEKIIQETLQKEKQYDLDPPLLEVKIFSSQSKGLPTVIKMGRSNPSDDFVYFISSAQNKIVLGEKSLQPLLLEKASVWKHKHVFRIKDLASVSRIENSFGLRLERSATQAWEMKSPHDVVVDPSAVDTLLRNINALLVEEVISLDDEKDRKNFGLDRPIHTLLIQSGKGESEKQVRLILGEGSSKDTKDSFYLQRDDWNQAYRIRASQKDLIFQNASTYIDKNISQLDANDLQSLSIDMQNQKISLSYEKNRWLVKEPFKDLANPRRVRNILEAIKTMSIENYVDPLTLRNSEKILEINLEAKDKKPSETVSFYKKGKLFYLEKHHPKKVQFSIGEGDPKEAFVEDIENIRNDDLLPSEFQNMKKIMFTIGNKKIEIEKSEHQEWKLVDLSNVDAATKLYWKQELTLNEFLNTVRDIAIAGFVPYKENTFKVQKPKLELIDNQGHTITWSFGEQMGEVTPLFSVSRNIVANIASSKVRELKEFIEAKNKK